MLAAACKEGVETVAVRSLPDMGVWSGHHIAKWWCRDIELDAVLHPEWPIVCSGHDGAGTRYLITEVASCAWLCVVISELALVCVTNGRAELRAAFAHSPTGTVEQVSRHPTGRYLIRTRLCRELLDTELPPPGLRIAA
jgi:hypothetical protein